MGTHSAALDYTGPIEVVPATFRDLFALYRLERRCFPIDSWPLIDIVVALILPRIVGLKATAGDRMIGFVMGDLDKDLCWIATIGVDPDYRRRGVGAALLEAVESAVDASLYRLCVRRSNLGAIHLYERFGYRTVDSWKRYYRGGEDALIMEKAPLRRAESGAGS